MYFEDMLIDIYVGIYFSTHIWYKTIWLTLPYYIHRNILKYILKNTSYNKLNLILFEKIRTIVNDQFPQSFPSGISHNSLHFLIKLLS